MQREEPRRSKKLSFAKEIRSKINNNNETKTKKITLRIDDVILI